MLDCQMQSPFIYSPALLKSILTTIICFKPRNSVPIKHQCRVEYYNMLDIFYCINFTAVMTKV